MKGVWLEDLTSAEARARFDRGDAVVIPIAGRQRHDESLPLGTGLLIARALGQRLLERLPVVVTPVVGLGPAVRSETLDQVLRDLVDDFRHQGAGRIALLDADTEARPFQTQVRGIAVLQTGSATRTLIERLDMTSVDLRETSLVLALAPRSLRRPVSAGPGDPADATAFKGERLLSAWIEDLVSALAAEWPSLAE